MALYEDFSVGDIRQSGDRKIFSEHGTNFVELANDLKQKWYEQSYVQHYPLGTTLQYYDRTFKYAQAGTTALVAGNLIQASYPEITADSIVITTGTNDCFNVNNGSTDYTCAVAAGTYTPTELCAALKSVLDTATSVTNTIVFTQSTGKFTITPASGSTWKFILLNETETPDVTSTLGPIMGFTADGSAAATMTSDTRAGFMTREELVAGTASTAGSYVAYVTAGSNGLAANVLKDGYYITTKAGTGTVLGHCYRIRSHAAIAASAIGAICLYDPLKVAIAADTEVGVFPSQYRKVIQAPATTPTDIVIGVAPRAVTASYYFWLQTWGPCAVLNGNSATVGVGTQVLRSVTTAGSVMAQVAGGSSVVYEPVGFARSTAAKLEGVLIDLHITKQQYRGARPLFFLHVYRCN